MCQMFVATPAFFQRFFFYQRLHEMRFSLVALMLVAALLVFGCGQDEKKEEAKKEVAPVVAAQKVLRLGQQLV